MIVKFRKAIKIYNDQGLYALFIRLFSFLKYCILTPLISYPPFSSKNPSLLEKILGISMIPIVLILRASSKFIIIRFGRVFTGRIGHFAADVDQYLIEINNQGFKSIDLLHFSDGFAANQFMKVIAKRYLRLNYFNRYLFLANSFLPNSGNYSIQNSYDKNGSRDCKNLYQKNAPQMEFKDSENQLGIDFLKSIGCNDKKFVCLGIRDSAFIGKNEQDDYRDSDIDDYKEAALSLTKKGYIVIRMGKVVEKEFNTSNPMVFDYASSSKRSDFLDIWLAANCSFYISTSTGLDAVAVMFRRPIAFVNGPAIGTLSSSSNKHSIWQSKKYFKKDGKTPLSVLDQINEGLVYLNHGGEICRKGFLVKDNTPEEIKEACLEVEAKISGTWKAEKRDILLQKKLKEQLKTGSRFKQMSGETEFTYSDSFLRKNETWFLME
tara:strand:+ start:12924 stop:14228 length:1305 start_codon:yes stop_codon:yes gene_type:complete